MGRRVITASILLYEWCRVARIYVVVIAPHRDRTFDAERPLTPVTELLDRHASHFASNEDKYWSVWTCETFVEMCPGMVVLDTQDPDDKIGNGFTVHSSHRGTEALSERQPPRHRRSRCGPITTWILLLNPLAGLTGSWSISAWRIPMSEQALRLGLAQLARSLRRVNPGVQFAFVRPGERLNRSAAPARARKVRRPGALPENERTVAHRRGMATATSLRRS